MPSSILATDNILAQTKAGQQRSQEIRLLTSQLAKVFKMTPQLLFVEDLPANLRKRSSLLRLDLRNPALIEDLKNSLKALHPSWQLHLESGDSIGQILKGIKELDPLFTVIATRGKTGIAKFFLGSVTEEVVRNSPSPVLVLGPKFKRAPIPADPKKGLKILVLSDLTQASARAENFAITLAKKTGGQVTLMSSVGDTILHLKRVYYQSRIPLRSMNSQIREIKKFAQLSMQKRANAFFKQGIPVKTKLRTREVEIEKDMLEEISYGYDLLLMGTHSRNRLLATFLGSTARKACLLSPIPVLILRSGG